MALKGTASGKKTNLQQAVSECKKSAESVEKRPVSRRTTEAAGVSGRKKTAIPSDRNELCSQREIFEQTVTDMRALGVYKSEYDPQIKIYAQLREQYAQLTERFERSRYAIQTKSSGGMKKAPIVATLEGLRKDILAYSDRLCLNPKSFDTMSIKPAPAKTGLERALEKMGHAS